jgi:hypothetical protein
MNYSFSNIAPAKDPQGNITGWIISYTGNNPTTGDYQNGTIHVTLEQFTATNGQVSSINALIAPEVQALLQ